MVMQRDKNAPWMDSAVSLIGVKEIPGPATAPAITKMLKKLRAWWQDDETPWCGTTVGYCMADAGFPIVTHWYRARAWEAYGEPLLAPLVPRKNRERGAREVTCIPFGAIIVMDRPPRPQDGHVGFYVGPVRGQSELFWLLGGNQGNQVKVAAFEWDRVVSIRWPRGHPLAGGAAFTSSTDHKPNTGSSLA